MLVELGGVVLVQSQLVVLVELGGVELGVVQSHVVEVGPDEGVLEDEDVLDELEDDACALGPQNCTFEIRVVDSPRCGRPAFENEPLNCDGVIEV